MGERLLVRKKSVDSKINFKDTVKGNRKIHAFWYFVIGTIVLVIIGTVYSVLPNPGHPANEIGGNNDAERTFNGTANENFTFPTNLKIQGNIGLNVTHDVFAEYFIGDGSNLTRVGATFVGKTPGSYTGSLNSAGGYIEANALCNSAFSGSHLCSFAEIKLTMSLRNISLLSGWSGDAWIASGAAKYTPAANPVNDCSGFTFGTAGSIMGNWWTFDSKGGAGKTGHCGNSMPLACCK